MQSKKSEINTKFSIGEFKIRKAYVYRVNAKMTEPFSISLGTQYDFDGIFVELIGDSESGYGECSTIPEITGEFPGAAVDTATMILGSINEKKYESLEEFSESITKIIYGSSAVKNAIEMAAHDLYAKCCGIHASKLLGGSMEPKETSLTITLGSVNDAIKELAQIQKKKPKDIKMKVGLDAELDIKRIRAVSDRLKGERFYVDANQGYSLQDAIKVGKVLNDVGAAFFEQPMERHELSKMAYLRREAGIPIMLDESISGPRDVIEAILHDSADYVNVKLTKSGGVRQALKTLFTAQAYGIKAMVGCMIESKLGIAASLAVALSAKNVVFYDLDGFQFIKEQPFDSGIEYIKGMNHLIDGKGFACKKLF
jgi:L-alanine-DL-glutamate epimerase-like enolase superfamily enzyme